MEQQNLLTEFEVNLVQVGSGKRLANFIVDLIIFQIVFIILLIPFSILFPDMITYFESDSASASLIDRIITWIIYGFFMGFYEYFTKGRTVGKIITGTKAVGANGENLSFDKAMLRGLSRIVPFEFLSAFGDPSYPWHDKWTDTYVVNVTRSTLPEQAS